MSAMSDYLEARIHNHILNAVASAAPASVYVALYTAAPSDSGGGTEVSGNNYSRAQMTAGWTVNATSGVAQNTAQVEFPVASGSWGTVTHIGIFDAASGGNLLYHGALNSSIAVVADDKPVFAAGDLTITLA